MNWNYLWAGYVISCMLIGTYHMVDKAFALVEWIANRITKRSKK